MRDALTAALYDPCYEQVRRGETRLGRTKAWEAVHQEMLAEQSELWALRNEVLAELCQPCPEMPQEATTRLREHAKWLDARLALLGSMLDPSFRDWMAQT